MSKDEILEICNKKHNYKFDYSLVSYNKPIDKVKIICPTHGIFIQQLNSHKTSGCPKCSSLKLSNVEFIKRSKKVHNNKFDYSLTEYKNIKTKVKIICPDHGIFEITPDAHLYKKRSCPMCSNRKVTTEMFIKKCKEIHKDKFDYSMVNYKNNHTKVKIICKEHGIFEMLPNNHLNRKQGCGKCVGLHKTTEDFIKNAIEIHNDKYNYSLVNYNRSHKKIEIICKKHNKIFKQTPHEHLSGQGCPLCNESKGENKISLFLEENNIKFDRQHRFENCKYKRKLPFDFYLPFYNTCIEYDGIQHFEPIEYWGGLKYFEEVQIKDKIKTDFCNNNKIRLIRIKYDQDSSDILNKNIYI